MNAFRFKTETGSSLARSAVPSKQLLLAIALCSVSACVVAENAVTVRAAELQAQSQTDSATVAQLPANTRVEVLRRSGAWSEVKTTAGQKGWVRMLALRFEEGGVQASSGSGNSSSGLGNLLAPGKSGGNATVTTGVRGLTAEELQNAHANAAELQKMQKFAVDRNAAQGFARRAQLTPVKLEYLPDAVPVAPSAPIQSSRPEY